MATTRNRWGGDAAGLPDVISAEEFFAERGRAARQLPGDDARAAAAAAAAATTQSRSHRWQRAVARLTDGVIYELRAVLGMRAKPRDETWAHFVHRRWAGWKAGDKEEEEAAAAAATRSADETNSWSGSSIFGEAHIPLPSASLSEDALLRRRRQRELLASARESLGEAIREQLPCSAALRRLEPEEAEALTSIIAERLERADHIPPGSLQARLQRRLGIAESGPTQARRMGLQARDSIVAFVMVCYLLAMAVDAALGIGFLVAAVIPESVVTHSGELVIVFVVTVVTAMLPTAALLLLDSGYWMLFRDTAHDRTSGTASAAAVEVRVVHVLGSLLVWAFLAFDLWGGRGTEHGLAYPLHSLCMLFCSLIFLVVATLQVLAVPTSYFWNHRRASHLARVPLALSESQRRQQREVAAAAGSPAGSYGQNWERAAIREAARESPVFGSGTASKPRTATQQRGAVGGGGSAFF